MNVSILVLHCDIMKHCKFLFTRLKEIILVCCVCCLWLKQDTKDVHIPTPIAVMCSCIPVSSIGS